MKPKSQTLEAPLDRRLQLESRGATIGFDRPRLDEGLDKILKLDPFAFYAKGVGLCSGGQAINVVVF